MEQGISACNVFPSSRLLQGSQGNFQDPAAFVRTADDVWAEPGVPLLSRTKVAPGEHKHPGAGQTRCVAAVRSGVAVLCRRVHRLSIEAWLAQPRSNGIHPAKGHGPTELSTHHSQCSLLHRAPGEHPGARLPRVPYSYASTGWQ